MSLIINVSASILSSVMVGGGSAIAMPTRPNNGTPGFFPRPKVICFRNRPRINTTYRKVNIGAVIISAQYEPRHDKTNKMSVRPAKTQISLGIRPVWSEFWLSAWRKLGPFAINLAQSEDSGQTGRFLMRTAKTLIRLGGFPGWSESSMGAHSFCWFCHVVAQLSREGLVS